jgi:hypothetical protein
VVREEARLGLTFYRVEGEGEKATEAVGGEVGGRRPLMAWSSVRRWRERKGRGGAWACGCALNAPLGGKGKGRRRCDNTTRDNSVLSPKPLLLVIKR